MRGRGAVGPNLQGQTIVTRNDLVEKLRFDQDDLDSLIELGEPIGIDVQKIVNRYIEIANGEKYNKNWTIAEAITADQRTQEDIAKDTFESFYDEVAGRSGGKRKRKRRLSRKKMITRRKRRNNKRKTHSVRKRM